MDALFTIIIPLFTFMLVPVWIPIIGVVAGNVMDRVHPAASTPAQAAVDAAKVRSMELRSSMPAAPVLLPTRGEARLAA